MRKRAKKGDREKEFNLVLAEKFCSLTCHRDLLPTQNNFFLSNFFLLERRKLIILIPLF